MPTMPWTSVSTVDAAVKLWLDTLGPGLFGLACSGGADSIALADAAIEAAAQHVVVLTIDHGLSPGSAKVAEEVAAWARSRGAAAVVRKVTVEKRASIEAAARDSRYAALEALVSELGLVRVFLGHTQRDQAETVMMRIVRGTGPAGLAGIPLIRGPFVRPLLYLPRATIDAYVAARGLPTWDDPMNQDLRIARVRMRNQILPRLREENPALDEALARLAMSAREWMGVMDELAAPFEQFPIDCAALSRMDPAIRKRAIALALEHAGLPYDAAHLEQIDDLVQGPSRGQVGVDIPGARVVRTYDALTVERPPVGPVDLVTPAGPYELRRLRPGDRMRPVRLKGRSRKLSDLYIDAKIPRTLRQTARVLVRITDDTIVWAEYIGLAFGELPNLIPKPP